MYDVTTYGAVGDGVTNDRAAFAAADAAAGGTGLVYVPEGEYLIGSSLTLTSPVEMEAGASLTGSSTITFQNVFTAPAVPVFDEDLPVVFDEGAVPGVVRRWCAGSDTNSLIDATAIAADSGLPVLFGDETLDLGGAEVTITDPIWWEGLKGRSIITNGWRLRCRENTIVRGITFDEFALSGTSIGYMLFLKVEDPSGDDIDTFIVEDCTFQQTASTINAKAIYAWEDVPITGLITTLSIQRNTFTNVICAIELQTAVDGGVIADNVMRNIIGSANGSHAAQQCYGVRLGANYDDATWDNPVNQNTRIEGNDMRGFDTADALECHGIIAYGSGHIIAHNYIEDVQGVTDKEGVYVRGSGCHIHHNTLIDAAGDDASSSDGALTLKSVPNGKRHIVESNIIYYRSRGGQTAIRAWNCDGGGLIRGNVIYAESGCALNDAIHSHGGWEIEGNTVILKGGGGGIQVAHDYGSPTNTSPDLKASIRNNSVWITRGTGIRAGYCTDADLSDNAVRVDGTGVGIRVSSDGSIESPDPAAYSTRARVCGNRVLTRTGTSIHLKRPSQATIEGNQCWNSDRFGVWVENGTATTCTLDISGNTFRMHPESSTTANTYPCVYIEDTAVQAVRLIGNRFEGAFTTSGGYSAPFLLTGTTLEVLRNHLDVSTTGTSVILLRSGLDPTTVAICDNYFGPLALATKLVVPAGVTIGTALVSGNTAFGGRWASFDTLPLRRAIGPNTAPTRYTDRV